MNVRTRFAPSPTGTPESVHLGFVIRALWNYAFAKKNGGQFVLRIEDTDKERSRPETEKAILDTLRVFKIYWDEGPDNGGPYGPYRQSERLKKYKAAAKTLVEKGFAYYDFEAPRREKEEIEESYKQENIQEILKQRPKARSLGPKEAEKRVLAGEDYV
ncbi:glutamate--tRNA ligase, partial [Candidatus Microgenomates bacterium]|nr:glutamate--tRNA ligase [Candidatus Microgenomates bacterium]